MAAVKPWAVKSTDDILTILTLAKTGGGTLSSVLEIVGTTITQPSKSEAQAKTACGDIAAKTFYGPATTMVEVSSSFRLKTGVLLLSDLFLGTVSSGLTITGIDIKTSNSAVPTIDFTGHRGKIVQDAPTDYQNKWALPAITINGKACAQDFGGDAADGFSVGVTLNITGSGLNFTCEFQEENNGEGTPVTWSVKAANGSGTIEANAIADIDGDLPAFTVDTDTWTITKQFDTVKAEAAYWTGSGAFGINADILVRTAAA